MNVLGLIHGDDARAELFGQVAAEQGHVIEEWSLASGRPLPRPLDEYGSVIVFGGAMHADQDDRHPWLLEEDFFLRRLLELRTPVLGVCLGAQLLAKAAHAPVLPAREPEIGWCEVEVTGEAADDPLLGRLPQRFLAFQWHFYTYELPARARELARSAVCTQAFRLGDCAWGVQFHPEVTASQIARWIDEEGHELTMPREELAAETAARIDEWNRLGRILCGAFLEVAERAETQAVL